MISSNRSEVFMLISKAYLLRLFRFHVLEDLIENLEHQFYTIELQKFVDVLLL